MAQLIRDRDGEGYFGSRIETIDPETGKREFWNGEPESLIGKKLEVGTMTAGMFSSRDWWRTTTIIEIISEDEEKLRFKTENSTYTLRR